MPPHDLPSAFVFPPPRERDRARERIDVPGTRNTVAILAVLAPVVEHVGECSSRLPWVRDLLRVIAIDEHVAPPPLDQFHLPAVLAVDVLGRRDLEALHAAR